MENRVINNIDVTVMGGEMTNEELAVYLKRLQGKQEHKIIAADVTIDGEFIDVSYKLEYVPFERIRRITGYLVGSTERWCDSKQAEERDRVKHS